MHFIRPYGFLSRPIYVSDRGWHFYLAEWGVFYLWFIVTGLLSSRLVKRDSLSVEGLFPALTLLALAGILLLARAASRQKLSPEQLRMS